MCAARESNPQPAGWESRDQACLAIRFGAGQRLYANSLIMACDRSSCVELQHKRRPKRQIDHPSRRRSTMPASADAEAECQGRAGPHGDVVVQYQQKATLSPTCKSERLTWPKVVTVPSSCRTRTHRPEAITSPGSGARIGVPIGYVEALVPDAPPGAEAGGDPAGNHLHPSGPDPTSAGAARRCRSAALTRSPTPATRGSRPWRWRAPGRRGAQAARPRARRSHCDRRRPPNRRSAGRSAAGRSHRPRRRGGCGSGRPA